MKLNCVILTVLFFCNSTFTFAAAPITHLYFAHQWLTLIKALPIQEEPAFIIGNLFPDIRYLGEISRQETHETGLTLQDVYMTASPFLQGTRLHALIDEKREQLVIEWKIYPVIENFSYGYRSTLLKLIEDEILYNQTSKDLAIKYLDEIVQEEFLYRMPQSTLLKWHGFLKSYLQQRPILLLTNLAKNKKGFFNIPAEVVLAWSQILPDLANDPVLIQYVDRLTTAIFNEATIQNEK